MINLPHALMQGAALLFRDIFPDGNTMDRATLITLPPPCSDHPPSRALMQGAALLFWDIFPDGNTTDRAALHASCPTTKGFKWTATRWIHTVPYAQQQWSTPSSKG